MTTALAPSFELEAPAIDAAVRPAQQPHGDKPVPGGSALAIGGGLTRDPDTGLVGASADFPIGDLFTLGPALQLAVFDDETTIVAPMLQVKRFFPLNGTSEFTSRLLPFAQAAIGVAFLDVDPDGPGPSADDEGLLIGIGGGVRYAFTSRFSLGSQVQFNFLPDEPLDEELYFSWEIAQIVFTF